MRRQDRGVALPLVRAGVTDREAEVLFALGERLRNREIAERLRVSVRTVESHVAALLRKLGLDSRTALAELGAELRREATNAVLPVPLTKLVGRSGETDELAAMLDTHRLITLVGPGGVGKTRLALHVAAMRAARFPDGARLADLAPVRLELVGDTLARALGVVPQPGWPLRDVLRTAAGEMRCLLLVDNCEHVVDEVAEIVENLLTAGGHLRVLATSREPLGIPGEVSYPVPTLPVPTPDDSARAATAENYAAVRLFVDRATTALPGFVLSDDIAPAVATLCQRLDGLPLAIELAAARVRTFGPAELLDRLDQRFELLSAGARTAAARHRTLRGAIDWSYGLLGDDERNLFDRLGVFPADFDLDAARAIRGADHPDAEAMIALMPRLVDKSLVSSVGGATRRYRLLETIREYSVQQLAASDAESAIRRRHASYYLTLAEQGAEQLRTSHQRVWLDRMSTEQPNLRAALTYCIAAGDPESAWRWVAALHRFWDITGLDAEARELIEQLLASGDPPATSAVVAGVAAASEIVQPSDSRLAFTLAERAVELSDDLNDIARARASRALALGAIWVEPQLVLPALHDALAGFGDADPWESALTMQYLAQATGELTEALAWGRKGVALFRGIGDHLHAASTLFVMAQRAIYAGIADDEVHEWLTQSWALADAAGSEKDKLHASVGFGHLAWLRGDHGFAAQLMAESLPRLRRLGDQRCTGRALHILGEHAYEQGQFDRAGMLLASSVEAIARAGQSVVLVNALEALAAVCAAQGRARQAAVLLGTAHTARETASVHMRPLAAPAEKLRRSLQDVLGVAAFDSAHIEGRHLQPTQALLVDVTHPAADGHCARL